MAAFCLDFLYVCSSSFFLCLAGPVWHLEYFIREERPDCYALHCTIYHSLLTPPLGAIGRLCSVIVTWAQLFKASLAQIVKCSSKYNI